MRIAYSHARFIALLSHSQTFAIGLAKTYSVYRLRGRRCENNSVPLESLIAKTVSLAIDEFCAASILLFLFKNNAKIFEKSFDKQICRCYYLIAFTWGYSSVGRAPDLHSGGPRFESVYLHHR